MNAKDRKELLKEISEAQEKITVVVDKVCYSDLPDELFVMAENSFFYMDMLNDLVKED